MKVTKYPHRYRIGLSYAEFEALRLLVNREGVVRPLPPDDIRRMLKTKRFAQEDGPLSVDEEKPGVGGWSKGGAP